MVGQGICQRLPTDEPAPIRTIYHILANKHLPEMPTDAEVQQNGVSVGDVEAILLKKVEELTLYIIELNKKLEAQQKQIESLKD